MEKQPPPLPPPLNAAGHEPNALSYAGPAPAAVTVAHVPIHYGNKTPIRVIIFAAVVAFALIVVFFIIQHSHHAAEADLASETNQASQEAIAVDVVRVRRAAPQKILTLPGDARSFYQTTIFARTSGYLSKWLVDIGDHVKEGQVLATIETPELDDQVKETEARLAQIKAEANVAATSAQFAKISFNRWEAAAPDGVVSAQERDQKKSEMDQGIAKLAAANSAVNLGEAELQRLQTLEKFKTVIAPFEGIITERHIDIGALVTAGSTTNTTPLFTLSQSNQIRVFVDVPQPAVPDIHIGMAATASVRELPGEIFHGTVDRTAASIDVHSRTLKVEVLVPNPKFALLPGMYVQVTFHTNRENPPLRIPPSALAFGPHGAQVAVIGKDGRVNFQPVVISRDLGNAVEIGSGLNGDEVVALNMGNQVVEGERVEPHFIDGSTKAESSQATAGAASQTQPTLTAEAGE